MTDQTTDLPQIPISMTLRINDTAASCDAISMVIDIPISMTLRINDTAASCDAVN